MKTRHPNIRVWVALLFCVNAVACVRSLDGSKVRCSQSANCPSGYTCSAGRCVVNGGSSSYDGAAGEADGTSRLSDASAGGGSDGAEEVGLTDGWASGGSGGNVPADAPSASGGTTAADAPISTGGSPSDAPISSGRNVTRPGAFQPQGAAHPHRTVQVPCKGALCVLPTHSASTATVWTASAAMKNAIARARPATRLAASDSARRSRATPRCSAACIGSGKCKGQCDGMNATACLMPGSSTVCQAASCMNGSAIAASTCNGSGACVTPAAKQCTSNPTRPRWEWHLRRQLYINLLRCRLLLRSHRQLRTEEAQRNRQHLFERCRVLFRSLSFQGICCNSDCTGQCQTCNNSPGTCNRVSGGQPVGGRPACANANTTCRGSCDGSTDTACHVILEQRRPAEAPLALPIPHRQSRRP